MKNFGEKQSESCEGSLCILTPFKNQIFKKLHSNQIIITNAAQKSPSYCKDNELFNKNGNLNFKGRKRSLKRKLKIKEIEANIPDHYYLEKQLSLSNRPLIKPKARYENIVCSTTEIGGNRIYFNNFGTPNVKMTMNPRRIQLLGYTNHLQSMKYPCESALSERIPCEQTLENKTIHKKSPLTKISKNTLKMKQEQHLFRPCHPRRKSTSETLEFQSPLKVQTKNCDYEKSGQNLVKSISEIPSEIFQTQEKLSEPSENQCNWKSNQELDFVNYRTQSRQIPMCNCKNSKSNEENIYKLALRRMNRQLEECKDTISAQKEQVNQYKMQINELNRTVIDLTKLLNKLSHEDLQKLIGHNQQQLS
ncbi:unnamed protein product [Moneuplotes crassus]|uniref:Uncharacterized protein n=1 Tax=Euplotes crassus TaxID=5936 RepID=A0AAD2CXH7_EUPCR|nr:unnamed protein product [Moneuplotes crassus]